MSYSIQLATPDDLNELVNVFELAFHNDRMTQIKARARPLYARSQYVRDLITPPLTGWLDPSSREKMVLCAVDTVSEEICGWICWGFKSIQVEELPTLLPPARTTEARKQSTQFQSKLAEVGWPGSDIDQDKLTTIEKACGTSMQEWISTMESTKHMFVGSICVLPSHQNQGLGRMLLDWGLKIADTVSVPVWVHSSEDAYATFAAVGFETQRSVTVDLHNLKEDLADLKPYVYRFMLRQPQMQS